MKNKSVFFKDSRLPFIEARYTQNSNSNYKKHFHKTLSIGAVEQGEVEFNYQAQEYILKPNSLAVINPYATHSCNPVKNKARTYHMIYVDIQWCKEIQEIMLGAIKSFIPLQNVIEKDKKLFDIFIELNKTLLDKRVFYLKKEEVLQNFIWELFNKNHKNNIAIKESGKKNNINIVKKAQNYISEHVDDNPTINDITKFLNISSFYFIKMFKQVLGITPHAFLLNLKISKAKELLKTISIVDTTYQLGFCDQSHLNRVFKQFVAATPYEYQKSIKE